MKRIILIVLMLTVCGWGGMITIPPGSNAKWVSNELKAQGLVGSSRLFYAYLRANQLTTRIHSGVFDIPSNASYGDIANILTGKQQQLIKVTIPEGFTIGEIAQRLQARGIINRASDYLAYLTTKKQALGAKVNVANMGSVEGVFFPDTYFFSRGSSFDVITEAFVTRFKEVLVAEYRAQKRPLLSFYDTLILASIIEKEAGTTAEMPTISGVFHNRLKKKMALASCPTVGYAMGQPRKRFLTYKDLEFESPYNTYKHRGLPPTPIASPGKQAFKAAMAPEATPYLYFVSKNDASGTHVFSLTLNEHLRNQKKILSKQR
jgi:UPF0755 protein